MCPSARKHRAATGGSPSELEKETICRLRHKKIGGRVVASTVPVAAGVLQSLPAVMVKKRGTEKEEIVWYGDVPLKVVQ